MRRHSSQEKGQDTDSQHEVFDSSHVREAEEDWGRPQANKRCRRLGTDSGISL
ncbi:hypothetical protein AVEN_271351-1, partial [Araneus ventricosus]